MKPASGLQASDAAEAKPSQETPASHSSLRPVVQALPDSGAARGGPISLRPVQSGSGAASPTGGSPRSGSPSKLTSWLTNLAGMSSQVAR